MGIDKRKNNNFVDFNWLLLSVIHKNYKTESFLITILKKSYFSLSSV